MIDLKRKAKAKKTTLGPEAVGYSEPEYAYGLKITFEKPELSKIGISLKDYSIGDNIKAEVNLEVVEIRSSDSAHGEPSESLGVQLTNIDLD